jgi:hypothetical protein
MANYDHEGDFAQYDADFRLQSTAESTPMPPATFETTVGRSLELPLEVGSLAVQQAVNPETNATTKESLAKQLDTAQKGYKAVIGLLNSGRIKYKRHKAAAAETIATEFEVWFTEDKLAWVTAQQDADPGFTLTLVATPNVTVTDKDLVIAKRAHTYKPSRDKYTPEQLSGANPDNGNSVKFSLIANKYTIGMTGTVAEQRAEFLRLQAEFPDLCVPSPLAALTFFETLRAEGMLVGNRNFDKTFTRHFNLHDQRVGDWTGVPDSYVDDHGVAHFVYFYGSVVGVRRDARLSVE